MTERKKGGTFFLALFGLIGLIFIGIMIVVFQVSRKANPVMLDDQGHPQPTQRP
jgi:F0F1-type ATP synthase assembly protein I